MQLGTVELRKRIERRAFLGGSDARIIMGNDEEALLRLWQEKRGEAEPPDYSDNLLVQLGLATEDLNRLWYERTTGEVIKDIQSWDPSPGDSLDGGNARWCGREQRRGV
jgi:predicted phage-related endonuclease